MAHARDREKWLLLAIMLALAVVLRAPDIGNPLIDLDEQFYLLVGERMWSGAIPYVDIWDRKPVGLFAIYWAARGLGGDPWLGYQLLALASAAASGWVIALFARRLAGIRAAMMAGAVYSVWIELLGGRGGQAPVFYNGLIAAAALLTWRAIERPVTARRDGLIAMLLVGLALQIKPTVVFEGGWFGLVLLVGAWARGERGARFAGHAAALVAVALAPTLVAFAVYAEIGHGQEWWFANVQSIFLRVTPPHEPLAGRLAGIALNLLVPAGAAAFGWSRLHGAARWVIGGWAIVTILAVLAIPPYFNHYALPLVVPIALLAGVGMAASRPFAILVGAAGFGLLWLSSYPHLGERARARRDVAALAATIDRYRGDGCLFAFSAPPVLYEATNSCLPTRYSFAPHLTLVSEAKAIGVDPVVEVRRILATRPPVIVTGRATGPSDPRPYSLVEAALGRDYANVGGGLGYAVYARRDRIRPPPPAGNP